MFPLETFLVVDINRVLLIVVLRLLLLPLLQLLARSVFAEIFLSAVGNICSALPVAILETLSAFLASKSFQIKQKRASATISCETKIHRTHVIVSRSRKTRFGIRATFPPVN